METPKKYKNDQEWELVAKKRKVLTTPNFLEKHVNRDGNVSSKHFEEKMLTSSALKSQNTFEVLSDNENSIFKVLHNDPKPNTEPKFSEKDQENLFCSNPSNELSNTNIDEDRPEDLRNTSMVLENPDNSVPNKVGFQNSVKKNYNT
ncbi:hypothetical protein AYI69_g11310 [Smittium culicis]|uniref:Uncharacterized protein n=1 Tax=Smittium culicis TaxID=133412 RepID=A0A1R1WZM4_9FUNG|nr:hypothetical protein AYI69_g11310 [Smittium culicis]